MHYLAFILFISEVDNLFYTFSNAFANDLLAELNEIQK